MVFTKGSDSDLAFRLSLRVEWPGDDGDHPSDTSVPETYLRRESELTRLNHFFERSCDAVPSAVALECEGVRYTYTELDERANRLAHHLVEVRPIRDGRFRGGANPSLTALRPSCGSTKRFAVGAGKTACRVTNTCAKMPTVWSGELTWWHSLSMS
jgi:hypothetical protein